MRFPFKKSAQKEQKALGTSSIGGTLAEEVPAAVPNHRFAPGTEVGFHPSHGVTVERGLGREPFAEPLVVAVVAEDGGLFVPSDLPKGSYCAAGKIGDRYSYVAFSVK